MSWFLLFILVGLALLIPTAYAGKIGAPFAPTRIAVVRKAFDALEVGGEDVLVDLGVGDGKIMAEARKRGAMAYGYELSPIMWAIAWVRLRFKPGLHMSNFLKKKLRKDTTIVFCFLMPHHMQKILEYIKKQDLPNGKFVLSYAFPFPDLDPDLIVREDKCAPLYVYDLKKL